VELPESLPAQLYLLTYNPGSERMAGRTRSGYLGAALRAAALVELSERGRIRDENEKVVSVPAARPGAVRVGPGVAVLPDDPILTRVLGQIESTQRRRSWAHWVGHDERGTTRCTRDYLESGRWLRVDRDRVLGIFPRTTVTVRDARMVRSLIDGVRRALVGKVPVDRVARRERQLAALGVLGEVRVLFGWREQRATRERAHELAETLGPAGAALRKVVRTEKAAAAAASSSGG
jgi:hypothetical protein